MGGKRHKMARENKLIGVGGGVVVLIGSEPH